MLVRQLANRDGRLRIGAALFLKDTLVGGKGSNRCVGGPGRDKGKGCEKGKL
jgi:hypothetical protein